jgi:hypothetical protein
MNKINELIWIQLQQDFNNETIDTFNSKYYRLLRGKYSIDTLQKRLLEVFLIEGRGEFLEACIKMQNEVQNSVKKTKNRIDKINDKMLKNKAT